MAGDLALARNQALEQVRASVKDLLLGTKGYFSNEAAVLELQAIAYQNAKDLMVPKVDPKTGEVLEMPVLMIDPEGVKSMVAVTTKAAVDLLNAKVKLADSLFRAKVLFEDPAEVRLEDLAPEQPVVVPIEGRGGAGAFSTLV